MSTHDREIDCRDAAYRLLDRSIDSALAHLQAPKITDRGIHQARKNLKRARAALRLLRPGLDEATYTAENQGLRDVARHLSPLRDSKAILEAYDDLVLEHPEESRPVQISVRPLLVGERLRARRKLQRGSTDLDSCVALLLVHRTRMRQRAFRTVRPDTCMEGLRHIYRKGRRTLRDAEKHGGETAFHEWRKQVKYLLNALDGLKDALDERVGTIGDQADSLSEHLGAEHDLAVLAQKMPMQTRGRTMQTVIEGQRAHLQKHALAAGLRLYERKPKKFVKDLLALAP
jgi:CHAD domain-containing protein